MNDFEIQRDLRRMNSARPPQNDLWAGIAARIAAEEAAPAVHRRGRWLPFAAAAGILLAVVAGTLVLGLRPSATPFASADTSLSHALHIAHNPQDFSRAPGGDPRLVGASVVLDAAHAEIEQALDQRPDAVFLVSLLNRTNAQRMKLEHYGARAG